MRILVASAVIVVVFSLAGCLDEAGATLEELYPAAAERAVEWNTGAWLMGASGTAVEGWTNGRAIAWHFRFHHDATREELHIQVNDKGEVVNETTYPTRPWEHPRRLAWTLGSDDALRLALRDPTFSQTVGEMNAPILLPSLQAHVMFDPANRTSYPTNGTWIITAHDSHAKGRTPSGAWAFIELDAASGKTRWSMSNDATGVLPGSEEAALPERPERITYYEDDVAGLLTPDDPSVSVKFPVETEGASAAVAGCYGRTLYVGTLRFSLVAPNGTVVHDEARELGRGAGSLYWSDLNAPAGNWEVVVEIEGASVSDYRLMIWVGEGFDERNTGDCWES